MRELRAGKAFSRFMAKLSPGARVLDIGAGDGRHADPMRAAGLNVTTIDLMSPVLLMKSAHVPSGSCWPAPDIQGDYLNVPAPDKAYQAIWCSHVVEHQRDVGAFLRKMFSELEDGGLLAVTVPPMGESLVGGHLNQFTEAGLVYNLVCAGFDCAEARVGIYGYNISVLVEKRPFDCPVLCFDAGDIEALRDFFPWPVHQAVRGRLGNVRW